MKKLIIIYFLTVLNVISFSFAAGDASAGKELTAVCAACHGADGNSPAASFPIIAGQGERYLLKQLRDVKAGARVIGQMTGLLDNLSDQQLADMAAYYASQVSDIGEADPDLFALGQQLYKAGNAATGVPACIGCHAANGKGNAIAGFPALGGQYADYTVSQLRKFQNGYRASAPAEDARMNDGDGAMMRTIAHNLKDFEIEALASYIRGLH